ncbi:hypothetical protein HDU78_011246 [Chytriomyces hyalinus]|nr:hypothetical protein HDU78_011246 [Chytriomyces hyalinus]
MANIASPYERYDRVWNAGPRLAYASCQWCRHFSAVSDATALLSDLALFCQENLLHWIETMLLLFWKSVDKVVVIMERIAVILKNLKRYAKTDSTAAMSTVLLSDALNMLRWFQEPLYFNPLQLYHSALLWCPQESALYKAYYNQYRENYNIPLLLILDGQELMKNWKLDHKLGKPDERRFGKTSEGMMTSIAISSKFILVGYKADSVTNSRVQLWRTGVEDPFKCFQWGRHVTAIAISPDDQWIVAGTADGSVVVQFLQEEKYLVLGDSWYKRNVKFDGIRSVSISCDEWGNPKLIAAASGNNKVTLWDYTNNFMTPKVLDGHKNDDQKGASFGKMQSVQSLAFSKNGKFLIAGSENGTVIVWTPDGNFYQKLATILTPLEHYLEEPINVAAKSITIQPVYGTSYQSEPNHFPVSAIAISHDGTKIAAGGMAAGTVNLWKRSGRSFNMVSSKLWHSSRVEKLEFTADSKFLFSAVKDAPMQVWNLQSMQSVFQIELDVICKTFALFPDEKSIATVTDANVRIRSLPDLMAFPDLDERVQEESMQHKKSGICEKLLTAPMPPAAVDRVDSGIEVHSFKPSTPTVAVAALEDPKPPEFADPQEWIDHTPDSKEKIRRAKAVKEYRRAIRNLQNQESVFPASSTLEQEKKEVVQKSDDEGGAAMSVTQSVTSATNGVMLDSYPLVSPSPPRLGPLVTIEMARSKEVQEEVEVRMAHWYLTKNGEHFVAAGNGCLELWDLKDAAHFSSKLLKDDRLRNDIKVAASEDGRFVVCGCCQYQSSNKADHAGTSDLVLYSLESNSDVAFVEFPHVCKSVEISGDGSVVAILSTVGKVYLWVWADGSTPVHLPQFSNIVKIGVSESLVACANAGGSIQIWSLDRKTGPQDGTLQLEPMELDKEYIVSMSIAGSSQIVVNCKNTHQHWFAQNMGVVERTWTLTSKTPILGMVSSKSPALGMVSSQTPTFETENRWIVCGNTVICWIPADIITSTIVEDNTVLLYPLNRLVALKFDLQHTHNSFLE